MKKPNAEMRGYWFTLTETRQAEFVVYAKNWREAIARGRRMTYEITSGTRAAKGAPFAEVRDDYTVDRELRYDGPEDI
jgi:hypothetical protein